MSLRDELPPPNHFGGYGWTRARITFLAVSALFVAGVFWLASDVLLPFILAVIIAYVLTPLVALCERIKIPRSVSILLVYILSFGIIYLSIAAIAPRVYEESVKLARDTPGLARGLTERYGPGVERWVDGVSGRSPEAKSPEAEPQPSTAVQLVPDGEGGYYLELRGGVDIVQESPTHWRVLPDQTRVPAGRFSVKALMDDSLDRAVTFVKRNALELIKVGQAVVARVARGIFILFMTLMVAGYIMHTRERIVDFFRSLPPQRARASFDRLLWRMDRGLSGVVRGQLLICLVNGILSAIGFWIFDLKYWPILAIIAAVMSIIPIFGSILSTVPAVLIGLTQSFGVAFWVLIWIIGIHQIEANLLNPKIIGVAAKIHPVLVVFALVVGEHSFGLWGALLAVPAVSLAQSLFNHFRFESMPDVPPDSVLPEPPTKA